MSDFSIRHRYDYHLLLAFAFTAVASIALQNLIWLSIAAFLFWHFKNSEKISWPSSLFPTATILFLATFVIGAIVGINPSKSFQTVDKYLTFLILFPVGAMALSIADIRRLLNFFIAGATVCAIFGIGKHFLLHQDRIDSFSGDKMVFGGMLMVSLLLNVSLLAKTPKNFWLWSSLVPLFWALILTQTRGAWLGLLFGFLVLTWRFNKKWLLAGLLIFVTSFLFAPQEFQKRLESIGTIQFTYNDQHQIINSSQTRFLIWVAGMRIIKDYPLGIGQGNIDDIYPKYRIPNNKDIEATVPHLHNNFMQILVQNGWFGLAAYLFWIFAFYWESFRFKSPNIEESQRNWMFLCVFSSILVWGLTEYTFSHQFMYVQSFLLGLQINLWRQKSQPN
jgi:hypothetical protein